MAFRRISTAAFIAAATAVAPAAIAFAQEVEAEVEVGPDLNAGENIRTEDEQVEEQVGSNRADGTVIDDGPDPIVDESAGENIRATVESRIGVEDAEPAEGDGLSEEEVAEGENIRSENEEIIEEDEDEDG